MSKRKPSPKSKPDVEIVSDPGLASLWSEIESIAGPAYEKMQPGDITREILAEHYKVSVRNVNRHIEALVESGKWRIVHVIGPHRKPRIVLRRI